MQWIEGLLKFETRHQQRHCRCSVLDKTLYLLLNAQVQPRKTGNHPDMTEILLTWMLSTYTKHHQTHRLSNSYTMGCPSVRRDNPQALAHGLSYVQVDKHGITILYHLNRCRPYTSQDTSCLSW